MGTAPSQGKLLYHITHIDNIPSILEYGLMPRKELENKVEQSSTISQIQRY